MTHRADQIIDAVATALQNASTALAIPAANIFSHRELSLSDEQGELPAATVNFGEDEPTSEFGADNLAYIDSVLAVTITTFAVGNDEASVRRTLMAQRRQVHVALMSDQELGLTFIIGPRYGGAAAPEINATTEKVIGSLETTWRYFYRMNITDPGD
jgi:hypothetical protein